MVNEIKDIVNSINLTDELSVDIVNKFTALKTVNVNTLRDAVESYRLDNNYSVRELKCRMTASH
jgi:hypothetical protein